MTTVGIDLGGTKTMAVLVDDGAVMARHKRSTPRRGGPGAVLEAVARTVEKVDPHHAADAVGLGVPGPVRPETGVVPAAPNLPDWDRDVDVGAWLADRLGRRVVVGNDVNAGTLAEHRFGAGRGCADMLGVFAGTGIGAGLILDGRLRRGPRGLAGEIGHTYVSFRDIHQPDGIGRGELEDYGGRRALERRARSRHERGDPTMLFDLAGDEQMKSRVWAEALAAGDALTGALIGDAASALAAAMASAIALVDVELVVLGGGMAQRLGEGFRARVESELHKRAFAGVSAPLRAARLGDVGGALGAALLVEERS